MHLHWLPASSLQHSGVSGIIKGNMLRIGCDKCSFKAEEQEVIPENIRLCEALLFPGEASCLFALSLH